MNKTKIDWCDSTWNPVTGCLHGCEYCYARGIANRFRYRENYEINEDNTIFNFHFDGSPTTYEIIAPCYYEPLEVALGIESGEGCKRIKAPYPYGFKPTFHKYRLNDYIDKKGRNIFVCSMADLFGEWVPDEWIAEVFDACKKAPQHNYLFLTKNPKRYIELCLKNLLPERENMWYGMTITNSHQAYIAEATTQDMPSEAGMFLSIEPILEDISNNLDITIANFVDWVIIGAETGRRKDKVDPKKEWIDNIVLLCREANIPVFMKSSLADIWGEPLIQEFPEGLGSLVDYLISFKRHLEK